MQLSMKHMVMALTVVLTCSLVVVGQEDSPATAIAPDQGAIVELNPETSAVAEAIDAARESIDEAGSTVDPESESYTVVFQEQGATQESLSDLGQEIVDDALMGVENTMEDTIVLEGQDVFENSTGAYEVPFDSYGSQSVLAPNYEPGYQNQIAPGAYSDALPAPIVSLPMDSGPVYGNSGCGCAAPVDSCCKPACPSPCETTCRPARTRCGATLPCRGSKRSGCGSRRPIRNFLSRLHRGRRCR